MKYSPIVFLKLSVRETHFQRRFWLPNQHSPWNGGRWLNTCQWCPLQIWEWNILLKPRFSHEKEWDEFLFDGFSTWRSCTQYFDRKISQPRFHSRNKVEQKLITTFIQFMKGFRSIWGWYSNIRHLSNSLHICDEAFLSRSYTCNPLPYLSDHLPTHALMRKVMIEKGRVQRSKKRGLHKYQMTKTTQQYDMKAQG